MPLSKTTFAIKRNDTMPSLMVNVIDRGRLLQKQYYSLSGVTGVTFTMVDTSCDIAKILNQEAQITCVSGGVIQYNWKLGDTNVSGNYKGEFELSYTGGGKLTIPQVGGIDIEINDDLNNS